MKNLITIILLFFVGAQITAQVGINTDDPQATLDVNGTMRIQSRTMVSGEAKKILGVDENGMILELEMDDNLYIDNNKIFYNNRKENITDLTVFTTGNMNNLPSIIWPGAAGNGRAVVRISNNLNGGSLTITGIDMSSFATPFDAHGYTLMLYCVTGNMQLSNLDGNSLISNQFIGQSASTNVKQYEIVKLMYDGYLEKWLVMK
ncbi:MAG: hypothetical protein ACSHW7_14920 [Patiriisocius sp.]|uniref:hypothetical protein n=1 Tax=Patiriisocius sp. TaxID=2822396 RepID=UPI003EFA4E8B